MQAAESDQILCALKHMIQYGEDFLINLVDPQTAEAELAWLRRGKDYVFEKLSEFLSKVISMMMIHNRYSYLATNLWIIPRDAYTAAY